MIALLLRSPLETDHNFILSSWLKSFRTSPATRGIPSEVFYREVEKDIKGFLESATTKVAYNPLDPFQIYGYICFEKKGPENQIHFIYVKSPFRRMKIATHMKNLCLDDSYIIFTHPTLQTRDYLSRKWNAKEARFNLKEESHEA